MSAYDDRDAIFISKYKGASAPMLESNKHDGRVTVKLNY